MSIKNLLQENFSKYKNDRLARDVKNEKQHAEMVKSTSLGRSREGWDVVVLS